MQWPQLEVRVYWWLFAGAFLVMALWESWRPLRPLTAKTERRWTIHAVIYLTGSVVAGSLLRASPVFLAVGVQESRFRLLNHAWLPYWLRFVAGILMLDLVRYLIHVAMHRFYPLWRLHQVHHSDPDFDVSTAVLNHPLEVLIVQGVYLLSVAAFAPPAAAVLTAELLSVFHSLFDHGNVSLPDWLEWPLRAVLVTPDMHRIHHSVELAEQNANLGEGFPFWDRLFGTYVARPALGQSRMVLGLKNFGNERALSLPYLMVVPFKRGRG